MQKVSYLILLCLSLLSATLHAQAINEYVKFDTDSTLVVNAVTDTTYTLNSMEPAGDATSEGAPARVFVPMGSSGKEDHFLYKIKNPAFRYIFDSSLMSDTEVMLLPMQVKTLGETRYLYAAIKDGTDYKMIKRYGNGSALSPNNQLSLNFALSPAEICSAMSSSTNANCSNINTLPGDTKTFQLYFYMSASNYFSLGEPVSGHAPRIGSMYYEVSLSSKINDAVNIDIVEVKKGDRRVTAFYQASSSIANPKSVRVILRDFSSSSYDTIAGSGGGQLYEKEFPVAQESSIVINDLANDTTYTLSLAFVDKFNFSSRLSPTFDATPMAIEELLKKEACFLLTAGFGEEHYVIDYFRSVRDNVLSQFYFGRLFITTYYDLAPKYALIIYENETIRATIRGMGYMGYFIFNNLTLILGLSIIGLSFFFKQNKKKAI